MQNSNVYKRGLRLMVSVCAVTVLLTACGQEDVSSSSNADTTTAKTAPEIPVVTQSNYANSADKVQQFNAIQQNYLNNLGAVKP